VTSERTKVILARAGVAFFGVLAYLVARSAEGVFVLVEYASALGSSGVLIVVCFALWTRFGGPIAATLTLITGGLVYAFGETLGMSYPFITSVAMSFVVYVTVAFFERSRNAGV
jgi:SSS family solute:Na+ symporter